MAHQFFILSGLPGHKETINHDEPSACAEPDFLGRRGPLFLMRFTMRGFKLGSNKSLGFIATVVGLAIASPASAAYTITFQQAAADVVSTGNGSLNISALTFGSSFPGGSFLNSSVAATVVGIGFKTVYSNIVGPSSFGSGLSRLADSQSGNYVGVFGSVGVLSLPTDYISGSGLGISTATYNNSTIASLGLTPGSYVYSWGLGDTADTLTVQINDAGAVPEPATWAMMLLGFGGIGMMVRRSKRRAGAVALIA